MGLKKQKKKSSSNQQEQVEGAAATDELSLVKAAAWAWYQRGSGCSGSDSNPADSLATRTRTRTRTDPRPSRHKLETLSPPPGSLLLDLYEIEQITKKLNQLIVSCRRHDTAASGSPAGLAGIKQRNKKRPAEERKVSGLARIGLCRPGAADVIKASVVAGGGRRRKEGRGC